MLHALEQAVVKVGLPGLWPSLEAKLVAGSSEAVGKLNRPTSNLWNRSGRWRNAACCRASVG